MKIAIASGKGGTGKTTLATNLSTYISKELNKKVTLIDLDVEEPNSGLFIKGELIVQQNEYRAVPKWNEDACTMCGLCKTNCLFNAIAELPKMILVFPELCHSCYACSELCPEDALPMVDTKMGELKQFKISDNFTFMEGILDVGQESAVPLINNVKSYLKKDEFKDTIQIIDSPPGTSCPVIEAVKDADFVILITEPTPFGLHDLKLAVETMCKLDKKIGVVINRYGIGNDGVEKYCKENKISILGKIPNMEDAAKLYSKGKLMYETIPEIRTEISNIFSTIYTIYDEK